MQLTVASLKEWARTIKRDAVAYDLLRAIPECHWYATAVAGAVAAYALSPIDLIPDLIPVLGYADELIILPLGILLAVALIPDELMAEFRQEATRRSKPMSRMGMALVVGI